MPEVETKVKYSVVVPVYNAEKSISMLVEQIAQVMRQTQELFEIILVDDASTDQSWALMGKQKNNYPQIRAFRMMFNVGQYRATICGLEHAQGEFIITIDDDLQNPPKEITKLINAIKEQPKMDVVLAVPIEKKHSLFRRLGSALLNQVYTYVFNKPANLKMSGFRILRRHVVESIINHRTFNPVLGPLILKSTKHIANIEVNHCQRPFGRSNYNLIKLINATLDNIINYSSLPLKLISLIGISASLSSFLFGLFIAIKHLLGQIKVPGWTSLIISISFFFGLILFSIGLMGEYLIRILQEVSNAPRYIIRDKM